MDDFTFALLKVRTSHMVGDVIEVEPTVTSPVKAEAHILTRGAVWVERAAGLTEEPEDIVHTRLQKSLSWKQISQSKQI